MAPQGGARPARRLASRPLNRVPSFCVICRPPTRDRARPGSSRPKYWCDTTSRSRAQPRQSISGYRAGNLGGNSFMPRRSRRAHSSARDESPPVVFGSANPAAGCQALGHGVQDLQDGREVKEPALPQPGTVEQKAGGRLGKARTPSRSIAFSTSMLPAPGRAARSTRSGTLRGSAG